MRSALAVENRADTTQLALRLAGRTRVLFSPGGNLATPGSPGSYYSAIWFSSALQAMEMKVVGTTLTFVPQTAFSDNSFDRNPNVASFDGRNAAAVVLRIVSPDRLKFAEFGWSPADVAPYMTLYTAANGNYMYVMNAGGTGFNAAVPVVDASMEAQLVAFPNTVNREGYTVIQLPPTGVGISIPAAEDARVIQLSNYAIPLTSGLSAMGLIIQGGTCSLYLYNEVGALTAVTPGALGVLGVSLV